MCSRLQFGTDGWRGVIGETFTFRNLERVTQALVTVLSPEPGDRVVVGHDRRFLADAHADRVAEVLAGNGFLVLRAARPLPTPALSGLVVDHQARAGVMITASHNPPQFGGFKLKLDFGGSAPSEFTRQLEAQLSEGSVARLGAEEARGRRLWETVEFERPYFKRLAGRVDRQALAHAEPLTVVVDSMHGCGAELVATFLRETPHRVITLRAERDVLFGGAGPEPVPERLGGLQRAVREYGADLGLATDGDADRLAAVDETGRFLSAVQITPLLADHLITRRSEPGDLAKTTANTILLDRIAARAGRTLRVRPIGFKHLVPLLRSGSILIGGEESGGIGVAGYLPERDGILIGLLLVEMRASTGRPVSRLMDELWSRYGELHYRRLDLPVPADHARSAAQGLAAAPPESVAGLKVTGVAAEDGTRLELGTNAWVMVRCSGTEPVLRIYCEAGSADDVGRILDAVVARVEG